MKTIGLDYVTRRTTRKAIILGAIDMMIQGLVFSAFMVLAMGLFALMG